MINQKPPLFSQFKKEGEENDEKLNKNLKNIKMKYFDSDNLYLNILKYLSTFQQNNFFPELIILDFISSFSIKINDFWEFSSSAGNL
jgi:hypothetical protein